jgi:DNA-binding MarR family transcriptional regulator
MRDFHDEYNPGVPDAIDRIADQWARERPELDVSPIDVIGRISRLSRLLEKSIEETFASFGLGRGGFDVLAALRRAGEPYRLSPTELYNSLLISSGAMTNRIDRLEEIGLVERTPDPDDRRGVSVGLTPEGKKLIDLAVEQHYANERRLLSGLSADERKTLSQLLRKLLTECETSPVMRGSEQGDGAPLRSHNSTADLADHVE